MLFFNRDHVFDSQNRVTEVPRRKPADISAPSQVPRGTRGVREARYEVDESKINNMTKLGLTDSMVEGLV